MDQLKRAGVDGIKAILEAGWGDGMLYDRLDLLLARAVARKPTRRICRWPSTPAMRAT